MCLYIQRNTSDFPRKLRTENARILVRCCFYEVFTEYTSMISNTLSSWDHLNAIRIFCYKSNDRHENLRATNFAFEATYFIIEI